MTDDTRVREFFDLFTEGSASLDPSLVARCYASHFLSADPAGARPVATSDFLAALPRRAQMFADAGIGRAALTSLTHSRLDGHYLLARTEWAAPRLAGGDPVRLASSFLLHDDGDRLRIVLYLNHEGLGNA